MRHILLPLCLLALGSSAAHARLQETKDQLVQRFGPPHGTRHADVPGTTHLLFVRANVAIDVALVNGKSGWEVYSGVGDHNLTKSDFKALLTDNAEGHVWTPQGNTNWSRDDGAIADILGGTAIEFKSVEYLKLQDAYQKSKAPNVQGF